MKKIVAWTLAVAMTVGLTGCVPRGRPAGQTGVPDAPGSAQPAPKRVKTTVEEQVLVDEAGVRITAKGLETDGYMGPELKLLIENNSDTDLVVQTRDASVNDFMVETSISADVAAGKKSNDSIRFSLSELKASGIKTLADFEFSFHIFTAKGWKTYLDTEPITVKTSAADGFSYEYDDSGELLYEEEGVRILSRGISNDSSIFGPGLILYVENTGDEGIIVQARDVSVNGFMVDTVLSQEVAPGKRAVTHLTLMESSLKENEIKKIESMELSFHISGSNFITMFNTDVISLQFN